MGLYKYLLDIYYVFYDALYAHPYNTPSPADHISGLVALRVYAYWGRSRPVLITFVVLWSIAFAATTVEATIWLVNYKGNTRLENFHHMANLSQGRSHMTLFSSHALSMLPLGCP